MAKNRIFISKIKSTFTFCYCLGFPYAIDNFTWDKGGGKWVCPHLSVRLSVSKITQKRMRGFV